MLTNVLRCVKAQTQDAAAPEEASPGKRVRGKVSFHISPSFAREAPPSPRATPYSTSSCSASRETDS